MQSLAVSERSRRLVTILAVALWALILPSVSAPLAAANIHDLDPWFGPKDAIVVTDAQGSVVYARHPDLPLIPASTLKLLTALVALHELGGGYRFAIDFHLSDDRSLIIRGYGDPLLISEEVDRIAAILSTRLSGGWSVVTDDGFFSEPLTIPGVTDSAQPYDAPNGALCVNFNTVAFQSAGTSFVSGEPQTPLLPMVMDRIRRSGLQKGRIPLSRERGEATRYAGALFAHFLRKHGVQVIGDVRNGKVDPQRDRLIYRHLSGYDIDEVIRKMLEFSNNFIANQMLLAAGARRYGPPGNLDKAVQTALAFAGEQLGIGTLQIVEGSGISRKNRLSARQMATILDAFEPHRHLLLGGPGDAYKTGRLSGVRTRAGYLTTASRREYRYAVLFNGSKRDPEAVVRFLQRHLP